MVSDLALESELLRLPTNIRVIIEIDGRSLLALFLRNVEFGARGSVRGG